MERRVITCVAGATDVFAEYDTYAAFAKSPELRIIVVFGFKCARKP